MVISIFGGDTLELPYKTEAPTFSSRGFGFRILFQQVQTRAFARFLLHSHLKKVVKSACYGIATLCLTGVSVKVKL